MNLFMLGNFTLNSGAVSEWKIEADALTDDDIKALAEMIRQMVGPFSSVEGVPRGGLRLAEALTPFAGLDGKHLIVDDVLTTGKSMTELMFKVAETHKCHTTSVIGAVIFARGQLPHWIKAIFPMPECFWLKPATK